MVAIFCLPNLGIISNIKNLILQGVQSDAPYGLKPKLYKHWLQLYQKSGGKDFDSSKRRRFFSICTYYILTFIMYLVHVYFMTQSLIIVFSFVGNSYLDILHSNKRPFYNKGREEDSSAMDAYLMHSVRAYSYSFFLRSFY